MGEGPRLSALPCRRRRIGTTGPRGGGENEKRRGSWGGRRDIYHNDKIRQAGLEGRRRLALPCARERERENEDRDTTYRFEVWYDRGWVLFFICWFLVSSFCAPSGCWILLTGDRPPVQGK